MPNAKNPRKSEDLEGCQILIYGDLLVAGGRNHHYLCLDFVNLWCLHHCIFRVAQTPLLEFGHAGEVGG